MRKAQVPWPSVASQGQRLQFRSHRQPTAYTAGAAIRLTATAGAIAVGMITRCLCFMRLMARTISVAMIAMLCVTLDGMHTGGILRHHCMGGHGCERRQRNGKNQQQSDGQGLSTHDPEISIFATRAQ